VATSIVIDTSDISHLHDRAVVAGWVSRTEVEHAPKYALKVRAEGRRIQPLFSKEFTLRIFRFRNSITH
jgi:hypothetical protein